MFSRVGHVYWYGPPARWRSNPDRMVLWLEWSPRTMMAQPVLTVWAVPSAERALIREWLFERVADEVRSWLANVDEAGETWRDMKHDAYWSWNPDVGSDTDSA